MIGRGAVSSWSSADSVLAKIGIPVYGMGAVALGLIGLVSGDFADVWQPVPSGVPYRSVLAYFAAACFVLAGLAIQSRRLARIGAVVLGALYFIFGLLWL